MIGLCCEYLSVWCIWLCVVAMSHMRFRVNSHSIVAWMSRTSLLQAVYFINFSKMCCQLMAIWKQYHVLRGDAKCEKMLLLGQCICDIASEGWENSTNIALSGLTTFLFNKLEYAMLLIVVSLSLKSVNLWSLQKHLTDCLFFLYREQVFFFFQSLAYYQCWSQIDLHLFFKIA